MSRENWMRELPQVLRDLSIINLAIPGIIGDRITMLD